MPELIRLENDPRRDHFRYFASLPNPHVGVTVNVEVTDLAAACRQADASFYLCVMHAVALAADEVPQLRQRIHPDGILQYEQCPTSHIELLEDETYCYCTLQHHLPLMETGRIHAHVLYADEHPVSAAVTMEKDGVASLEFVASLPGFRRMGYAEAVCRLAMADAWTRGAALITVRAVNPAVARLYERLGFRAYNHAL